MNLLADTAALAETTRATIAHARANPYAKETLARLDEATRNVAALRCRTDLAAADALARARETLASITPRSSPWQRMRAEQAAEGAAAIATTARDLLGVEVLLRDLAHETAILHGVLPR